MESGTVLVRKDTENTEFKGACPASLLILEYTLWKENTAF